MSEARVAKRKTHTKSRKGCFQCKQRHTKCNEGRPRCANCVRLDISCTWPEVNNGYSLSPTASPSAYASPPEDSPAQRPVNAFELSIPNLRLLHHWSTKGYIALHPKLALRTNIWQIDMVELGFEYPFLLHGILALSAIHKASFCLPAERQGLLHQADAHISQALDAMRRHLQSPREETSIPMFVLSSVLLTYNFGSVQERPDDPIGAVHHCFMLLNGIKVVIGPYWDKIKDHPNLQHFVEQTSPATLAILDERAGDEQRPEIWQLMELTELVLDTQDKAACTDSIEHLHYIAVRCLHIDPERDDGSFYWLWGARASNHFWDLLAAHNPVACIITVYFAALMAQARQVWWVVKWPRWLLSATEQLLAAATPDLLSWLDWPRQIINSVPFSPAVVTPSST